MCLTITKEKLPWIPISGCVGNLWEKKDEKGHKKKRKPGYVGRRAKEQTEVTLLYKYSEDSNRSLCLPELLIFVQEKHKVRT